MGEGFKENLDKTPENQLQQSPIYRESSQSDAGKTLGILFKGTKQRSFIPTWAIALVVLGAIATGGFSLYILINSQSTLGVNFFSTPETLPPLLSEKAISGLGRIEPKEETIKLSARGGQGPGQPSDKLQELFVEVGDRVRQGQVIAILDSRDRLLQALELAKQQVRIAQANLDKVKAGTRTGDIDAQQAEIARLKAQIPRELEGQQAAIARLEAQKRGETLTQEAAIARLEAQQSGDIAVQEATIQRLEAELEGNIQAQQATIDRLYAELNNAQTEYWRYEQLYREGAISQSLFDTKRLAVQTGQERLKEADAVLQEMLITGREKINEAQVTLTRIMQTGNQQIAEAKANLERIKTTSNAEIAQAQTNFKRILETGNEQVNQASSILNSLMEVRPVDVTVAQAEVDRAIVAVSQAQVDLDQAYIKSPINGRILDIFTRPGELISNDGIVEIGQTDRMYVVAEIYETDISQVRLGQRATITSDAIASELAGTVAEIGWKIGKQDILDTDPTADVDVRVVEVKIRLDPEDSEKVSRLTNSRVEVKIGI
jgi:HlyD family secretion protein